MSTLELEKQELRLQSLAQIKDSSTPRDRKIVAEGDSWFDYPLVTDVLDHLRRKGYAILKCSKHGDTLENMVYGTQYKINKVKHLVTNPGTLSLDQVKEAVRENRPRFFLFSAGGNDIAGPELIRYLNHIRQTQNLFKEEEFANTLNNFMKPAMKHYFEEIWGIDSQIDIIMDGYDYAKPNGKGYTLAGLNLIGPWILPAFGAKSITDRGLQDTIIKRLVDGFNEMLTSMDNEYPKFHHIDLRGMFPNDNEWHNEIHLKGSGFKKVADLYHQKIVSILGKNPL